MTLDLNEALARRADSVDSHGLDPRAVLAHGERLVRRRRRLTAAGAVLALALTVGTTGALLDRASERAEPAQAPEQGRPLTYGEEQVLHLGDREIDTGLDFLSVDVTDDGAALTTLDGRIWFTDGTTVEQVGKTIGGRAHPQSVTWPANRPRSWVVNETDGSLLAWLEYPSGRTNRAELVVYDSGTSTILAREPIVVAARTQASPLFIADRQVFLTGIHVGESAVTGELLRYDVDARSLEGVDRESVDAARRSVPRALVVGPSVAEGDVLSWDDWNNSGMTTAPSVTVRKSRLDELFDPRTGDPVEIVVPDGYEGQTLWFVQWLDDDGFALISAGDPAGSPVGDLLECRIAAGRCDVALPASTWTIAPLLPGHGGLGGELALGRAMDAAVQERADG